MNLQTPELLSDLYRDLRERRLLPLIVVLIAAMVVVPIALSDKSKGLATTQAAPSVPVAVGKGPPLLDHPVVISDPGLRDFRRRLQGDTATDPFLPSVQGSSGSGGGAKGDTSATGGLTSTSSSSSDQSPGLTAEGKAAAAQDASGGSSTVPSSSTGSTQPNSSSLSPQTQSKYFFYRVKVKTGPVGGKMEVRDNVKAVTSLPDDQVPALAFLGVQTDSSFAAQKAVFIVNDSVSLVSGNGECSLAGTQCQLVTLTPGDHADLTWSDGVTYRVTLVKFNLISRSGTPGSGGGSGRKADSQQRVSGWNGPSGQHFSF